MDESAGVISVTNVTLEVITENYKWRFNSSAVCCRVDW